MSDILPSGQYDWVAKWTLVVLCDQPSQIENLVEEGNPAIVGGLVDCNFRWQIISLQFIMSWQVLFQLYVLCGAKRFQFSALRHLGRWNTSETNLSWLLIVWNLLDLSLENGSHSAHLRV